MTSRHLARLALTTCSILIFTALVSGGARAQDQGQNRDEGAFLEEILVTARKRDESLQDVPISITVFSAADIAQADLETISDLARLTPSFQFPDNGARYIDAPVIRGLIGNDADPTKQAGSFFLDGIYVNGSISSINFADVERVEVLRGPQSAQFGRATFAGAVNLISKGATEELSGDIAVKLATLDEYETTLSASGPLVDDLLSFRVSVRDWNFGADWDNAAGTPEGVDLGGQSTRNISGSLFFTPGENTNVQLQLRYNEDDDDAASSQFINDLNCSFATSTVCGAIDIDESAIGQNVDSLVAAGVAPGLERESINAALLFDHSFDDIVLSGSVAWHEEDMTRGWDVEGSPVVLPFFVGVLGALPGLDAAQILNDWTWEDFQAELRLSSAGDSALQWSVGAYYADFDQTFGRTFGAILLDPPNRRLVENWSVFGQLSYQLTEQLTVGFEGRYQSEDLRRVDAVTKETLILGAGIPADKTFTEFLPRISANYSVNDALSLYMQVAQGNKPGDFNTSPLAPADEVVLEEESLWNYEIGAKGNFGDRRFAYSFSLFRMDLTDLQVRDVTPDTFQILTRNAGEARSQGFEVELTAAISEAWNLRAGVGYADFEFTEFENDAAAETIFGDGDVKGNVSRAVPKWTGMVSSEYSWPLFSGLEAFMYGDASYRSRVYASPANVAYADDQIRVNARAGLRNNDWTLELFGANIFDDDTPQRVGSSVDFLQGGARVVIAVPSRQRQFGLRASYGF